MPGPLINAGSVYLKLGFVDPAFIRDPVFNRENTAKIDKHVKLGRVGSSQL